MNALTASTSLAGRSEPIPTEREIKPLPGLLGTVVTLGLLVAAIALFIAAGATGAAGLALAGFAALAAVAPTLLGLFVVRPGQARVLVLLGRYHGTVKRDGWYWANPFAVVSVTGPPRPPRRTATAPPPSNGNRTPRRFPFGCAT